MNGSAEHSANFVTNLVDDQPEINGTKSPATSRQQKKLTRKPFTLKTVTRNLVLIFLVFNVGVYLTVLGKKAVGRPHFAGKAYMSAAIVTSMVYYYPLAKIVGPENFPASFFNNLTIFFKKKGREKFPENDAESALWSVVLYKMAWNGIYRDEFNRMQNGNGRLQPDFFMKLTDELYGLLEPLATLPLADSQFHKQRLFQFVTASKDYLTLRKNIIQYLGESTIAQLTLINHPFLANGNEIARCYQILGWVEKLKTYCKKNEEESYHVLINKSDDTWWIYEDLIYESTRNIIGHMLALNNLKCDDEIIAIHLASRNILLMDAGFDNRIKNEFRARFLDWISNEFAIYIVKTINSSCYNK